MGKPINLNVVSTEMFKVDKDYVDSHYTRPHWSRAMMETQVWIGDAKELMVALIDHGSEINLMSMDFLQEGEVPDQHETWMEDKSGDSQLRNYMRLAQMCM